MFLAATCWSELHCLVTPSLRTFNIFDHHTALLCLSTVMLLERLLILLRERGWPFLMKLLIRYLAYLKPLPIHRSSILSKYLLLSVCIYTSARQGFWRKGDPYSWSRRQYHGRRTEQVYAKLASQSCCFQVLTQSSRLLFLITYLPAVMQSERMPLLKRNVLVESSL